MGTENKSSGSRNADDLPVSPWYDSSAEGQIRRAIADGRYHKGFRPRETAVNIQGHSHACAWRCEAVLHGATAKDIIDERRRREAMSQSTVEQTFADVQSPVSPLVDQDGMMIAKAAEEPIIDRTPDAVAPMQPKKTSYRAEKLPAGHVEKRPLTQKAMRVEPVQPAVLALFPHIVGVHTNNRLMQASGIRRTGPLCKRLETAADSATRNAILLKASHKLAIMVTLAIVTELQRREMLEALHAEEIRRAIGE